MPTFRKSPPELIARFDELADLVPEATRRQMFGYPSCVTGGNMFMGLHEESMILRLSDADRTEFLAKYEAEVFEPMPGRPMREYVVVPAALAGDAGIEDWIARSYSYARGLPAKKAKPAGKAGRQGPESLRVPPG